jgi:hypothetical protein
VTALTKKHSISFFEVPLLVIHRIEKDHWFGEQVTVHQSKMVCVLPYYIMFKTASLDGSEMDRNSDRESNDDWFW